MLLFTSSFLPRLPVLISSRFVLPTAASLFLSYKCECLSVFVCVCENMFLPLHYVS